jgi:hypothetical protein
MWEAEIGRIAVPAQPRQKTFETPSQHKKLGVVVLVHTTVENVKQESRSPSWPGQKPRPYLQNHQSKEGGGA